MPAIIDFLDPRALKAAFSQIRVEADALERPEEAALACLFTARLIMAGGHRLSDEDADRAANLIEFGAGVDWRQIRSSIEATGSTPGGSSRLLRIFAHQLLEIVRQQPSAYPVLEARADAPLLEGNGPQRAAEEFHHALTDAGLSPVGASSIMILKAVSEAQSAGASRWLLANVLAEALVHVLEALDADEAAPPQA